MKKTLVIGASENTDRYSNKAIRMLLNQNHPVVALGMRTGSVEGVDILTGLPDFKELNTVTMYVGPANQPAYYDYILGLKPQRIIFNPGTENPEFETLATAAGIACVDACTLVMLSIGAF